MIPVEMATYGIKDISSPVFDRFQSIIPDFQGQRYLPDLAGKK